jgi:predicted TPR repeat methyltransferase
MTGKPSLPASYFDALYASDPDPWRFASSEYERGKYAATMAALPPGSFDRAFEIGCSIGVLTRQLAQRCQSLLAVDVAEAALAQARARCADLPNVELRRMQIPQEWPRGRFDLILISEVLYYLSADDLARTAKRAAATLSPGGALLLVHYILPTDYPATGDAASEAFMAEVGRPTFQQREADYRLDLIQPGQAAP